jgi:hypothetical protein
MWVVVIVVVLGVACNFAVSEWMKSGSITDTEYIGNFAARVEYYEPWDEWVEETCTNENGEEYDCSHSVDHEARWKMVDYSGYSYPIERHEYGDIVNYVNGKPVFKELHRDYYRIDGDMYYVDIPEARLIIPITRSQGYVNRMLLNQSLYHYEIVSDDEKDSLGLYDYPEIVHYSPHPYPNPYPKSLRAYQSSTMGIEEDHPFTIQMNMVNGKCGEQLRAFVFFYQDKKREIAKKQIDRLQLGNFNELLIMLGTQGNEITWCEAHSWEDVPTMRTAVKQWFTVHNSMDSLTLFPNWYAEQIMAGLWTLKDAHDFDYVRVSFSLAQIGWLCVAQIVFQVLAFLYIVFFIRRHKRIQSKYKLDEETKTFLEQYRAAYHKTIVRNEKLTREEWKIFNDEKQYEADSQRNEDLTRGRKNTLSMYTAGLLLGIPTLAAFIPGIVDMIRSFGADAFPMALLLIIPSVAFLIFIPIWVTCIVALKKSAKKEAKQPRRDG